MSTHSVVSEALPPNVVLLVSARAEDRDSLQSIFRGTQWELQVAWTASDGVKELRCHRCELPVVICEDSLPDGDWKRLLAEVDQSAVRPSLIVCSRLADERLWAEVLNLGAFDLLLGAPFVPEEVLRVTQSAWLAFNRAAQPRSIPRMGPELARGITGSGAWALAAGSPI